MKRRRIKRKSLGVSLFPFLAVLICTLGVLIILLVLAVRSADVRAQKDQTTAADTEQQQRAELSKLEFENDLRLVAIEGMTSVRPDILEKLSGAREHRGHLESEIRELKKKVNELGRELMALQQSPPENIDHVAADLITAQLKQQILAASEELTTKRTESQTNAAVTYAIVPHAGSGGTFRRPIFIECTSDALVIQPLGIRLEKSEFLPPLSPGNMLDAALLAIREYWQRYDLDGTEGSPYPLLVVRPNGAETYALARHAMSSWEDEFGYELVEANKTLEFGKPDEQLAKQVQAVVDEARVRQQSVAAMRMAQHRAANQRAAAMGHQLGRGSSGRKSDQRPGLTASGNGGGFVANSNWRMDKEDGAEGSFNGNGGAGNRDSFAQSLGNSNDRHVGNGSGESGPFQLASTSRNGAGNSENVPGENDFGSTGGSMQAGTSLTTSGASTSATSSSSTGNVGGGAGGQTAQSNHSANANGGAGDSNEACQTPAPYSNISLAKQRGKDWALPTRAPGTTAYVRPIRVVCSGSDLEVRSALGVEKTIPIGAEFTDCVDPLVNEIWRQIESWGLSGERSYWKPELRISVVPGGELNFEKLRGALLESGVDVRESQ